MHVTTIKANLAPLLVLISGSLLLAVWPTPGVIALRNILLTLGSAVGLLIIYTQIRIFFTAVAWPFSILLGFFGWLFIHFIFLSNESALQIGELKSLWLRSFAATIVGIALGLSLTPRKSNKYFCLRILNSCSLPLVFAGLLSVPLVFFVNFLYEVLINKVPMSYPAFYLLPFKAKTPFVISSALFLPLCFILIMKSIKNQIMKKWIAPAGTGVLLVFFGDFFASTRNGMAIAILCLVQFILCYLFSYTRSNNKNTLSLWFLTPMIALLLFGIAKHIDHNPSWKNLIADVKVGIDIDNQYYWRDRNISPLPINELGNKVNVSTYERTAWFTAGLRLLAENPQGYGLAHHSFGSYAMTRWPNFFNPIGNTRGATHSGWLDFALGVGIPGLLLVLIPLWVSWYRSLFQKGFWFSYTSWTIPIMVFAYLIAEVTGSHFTEMLFFMTSFFCGITLRYPVPRGFNAKKI